MEKGKIIKVKCDDLTHQGEGVCRCDGFLIFVNGLIPNEEAEIVIEKVNKSYALGKILKVITKNEDRVEPICDKFGLCGGCEIMHLEYSKQLEFKKKMVSETLKRLGHLENVMIEDIIGMDYPYYYRNKVQIPFENNKGLSRCGFYKQKTHEIIELTSCYIQPKLASEIAIYVKELFNKYKIVCYDENTKTGSVRHLLIRKNVNDEYMLVFICKDEFGYKREIIKKIITKFPSVKSIIQNFNTKENNVILGNDYKVLYGVEVLEETLCGLKFKLSHQSFFQTNHEQTEKLYEKVLEYASLSSDDIVLDAYCGVGSISLLLATKAKKVYGIEIVKEAINNAKENAILNKINNAIFLVGKSEEEIYKLKDIVFDVVVVDPPRKGLEEKFITAMIDKKVKKIIYVSCDPGTLARDLMKFSEYYDIEKITLVDMFPHTCHVESVTKLILK